MSKVRNDEYYKCVLEGVLRDNDTDFETFYPLLEQHIKDIIADNIEVDIINIMTEVMQYILTLKKKEKH